jgi:hypothetical protein
MAQDVQRLRVLLEIEIDVTSGPAWVWVFIENPSLYLYY